METIWLLVLGGLFAGWFALDGFSLGVGMLLPYLGGRPDHRRTAVTAFGPFFLANEVWLLARAGAVWRRARRGRYGWRAGEDAGLTNGSTDVAATWGLLLANVAQGLP